MCSIDACHAPGHGALGYLSVLLVLAAFTAPLAAQATTLPDTLPRAIQRATQQADDFLAWLRGRHIPVPFSVSHALESGVITEEVGPSLLSWPLALLNTGGQFLLVICIAAAMAAGDNTLRSLILAAMPTPWLKSASLIYDDVRRTYSAAIRGQLAVWSIGMALSLGTMAAFGTPGLLPGSTYRSGTPAAIPRRRVRRHIDHCYHTAYHALAVRTCSSIFCVCAPEYFWIYYRATHSGSRFAAFTCARAVRRSCWLEDRRHHWYRLWRASYRICANTG